MAASRQNLDESTNRDLISLLDQTRTFRGLFKIIKCDATTFEGCESLQNDLKTYYLNSEPEVRDMLEIAMNAFLRQGAKCSPHFRFESEQNNAKGYFSYATDPYDIFRASENALGCEVVISAYNKLSREFWATFVHEMAHKAFYVLYRNDANPYSKDPASKAAFDEVMNPIVARFNPDTGTVLGNLQT